MSTTDTLFATGRPQVSGLDAGNNPTRIHNEAKQMLKSHTMLPNKTTPRAIEQTARVAGQMKARNQQLKMLARNKQQIVQQALGILQTRTAHSNSMQRAKVQYAQIMSKHGENIALNGMQYAQINAGYSGFDAEFQQAESMVTI